MNENSPLVTELMARAGGASATDAAAAARAGSRGLGDLPARTSLTVAASVVAVVAIAADELGPGPPRRQEERLPGRPGVERDHLRPQPAGHHPDDDLPDAARRPAPRVPRPTCSRRRPTRPRPRRCRATPRRPTRTRAARRRTRRTPRRRRRTRATSPTDPTWSPTASPTKVTPGAPTATKITRCGTYGRLTVPKTAAVRYELTVGNGRQGRWVIRAFASKGYEITSGATTRWSGNLGKYFKCPSIKNVTTRRRATETDQWLVTVSTAVSEKDKRTLSVVYEFDTEVTVVAGRGRLVLHRPSGGPDPRPVHVHVRSSGTAAAARVPGRRTESAPSGTVTLFANVTTSTSRGSASEGGTTTPTPPDR